MSTVDGTAGRPKRSCASLYGTTAGVDSNRSRSLSRRLNRSRSVSKSTSFIEPVSVSILSQRKHTVHSSPEKPVTGGRKALHTGAASHDEDTTIDKTLPAETYNTPLPCPEKPNDVVKNVQRRKQYESSQVAGALADMVNGMKVKTAALKWSIPRTTLQRLKKSGFKIPERPGPQTVLTSNEENLLVEWLIELARRGIPIQKRSILDSIQKIIHEDSRMNPFTDGRPGKGWFRAFMRRHPQLAERNAESICRGRGSLTEGCIRGWFGDAKKFFSEKNCEYILTSPTKQYNGDETGFQLDPKSGKVLAPVGEVLYTESGGLKEQVSVLITTRADGKLMTSGIIYPYKRAVPKDIVDKVPPGFCIARSDSGWMTSDIFFEYFANCFIPELAAIRRQEKGLQPDAELILDDTDWVVYWIDGYSSHLTIHTSQLCEANHIWLYCFKAHASHICQPNDVGPFKPLKAEWRMAVSDWRLEHPYDVLTRMQFAPLLSKALEKLDSQSVVSGYRATGLCPFNEDAVHYERLTATNRTKYDGRSFNTNENATLDFENAQRCIEYIIGETTIQSYREALNYPLIPDGYLPFIDTFSMWKQLQLCSLGQEVDREILSTPYSRQFNVNASISDEFNLDDQTSTVDTSGLDLSFLAAAACEMSGRIQVPAADEDIAAADGQIQVRAAADEDIAAADGQIQVRAAVDDDTASADGQIRAAVDDDTAMADGQIQVRAAVDDDTAMADGQIQVRAAVDDDTAAADVILETVKTPLKAKRGIPSFYSGKVSPAFANHIFWPSPRLKNKSSSVRHEIVPACASSAQWREHHRDKVARKLLPKAAKQPKAVKQSKAAKVPKSKTLNSRNGHVNDALAPIPNCGIIVENVIAVDAPYTC